MRTNDPTEPERFKPFGEKVTKSAPAPTPAAPKPVGASGIVQDTDGKIRTTSHRPHGYPVEIWSYLP